MVSIREAARRLGVSDTAVHKAIRSGRVSVASRNPNNNRPLLAWPQMRDEWLSNSDSSKRSHVGGTGTSPKRQTYAPTPPEVALPLSFTGAGPGDAVGSSPDASRPKRTREAPKEAPKGAPKRGRPTGSKTQKKRAEPVEPVDAGDDDTPDFSAQAGPASAPRGPNYAESRALREAYQARLAKLDFEERSGKLVNVEQVKVEAFKAHRRIRDALLNIPDRCAPHLATITDPMACHTYLLEEIVAVLRQLSGDIYRPGGGAGV